MTPYSLSFVQVLKDPAPPAALDVGCDWRALKDDGGVAGSYFARYIAGWNVVPVSVVFPVTVFVVRDVGGKRGCSLGPLTDYITIDVSGVRDGTTMAHEVGHSCGLWHSATTANLMFHGASRGDQVKWFQRNVLRSSRHVTLF